MDTRQTLNVVDKYFNTFEILGVASNDDFITLLYLMFIDEYYEFNRDISLHDIDNDEVGLTDCLVKKLNVAIDCLKKNSNILKGVELEYLPTKYHWIIPDDHTDPDPGPEPPEPGTPEYIENNILYTNGTIINQVLNTEDIITNHILQL